MATGVCKVGAVWGGRAGTALGVLFAGLVLSGGCAAQRPVTVVTLASLEAAPVEPLNGGQRHVVTDADALRTMCTPLGPRLGLLQVRSRREWDRLAAVAPNIGPCPDLRRGTLVGLACWAGTPLDGGWPIELDGIQLQSGGGLLKARFHGGTYLPDGTARLETDYVQGLGRVLVVDVNGTSFYPDQDS